MFNKPKKISSTLLSDVILHLLFTILIVYSVVFYKERIFADSSYYLFKVIDHKHFWIEHNRFILVFSQLLPLIGVLIGLSLKTILLLYSIGHSIFFYSIFLICKYLLKQNWTGLILLLIQTVGILSGYFTPMFELYYGTGFLILFTSILYKNNLKWQNIITLILLSLLIFTSHQYTYFLMIFVLLFHFETNKWKYIKLYFLLFLSLLAVIIFKKYFATEYEIGKTQAFINTFKNGKYDWIYIESFINFLFQYYKEMLVIALITTTYFIYKKNFLSALIYIAFVIFISSMVNISNYGFEHSRYQEQVYFPLIFISCYPFVRIIINENKTILSNSLFIIATLIVVVRLFMISQEGEKFSNRVTIMQNIINKCQTIDGNKFYINSEKINSIEPIGTNWSYPIETLLISGINPNQKTVTICTDEDINNDNNIEKLTSKDYLFTKRNIYNINSLNHRYFNFEQTKYLYLDYDFDKSKTSNN